MSGTLQLPSPTWFAGCGNMGGAILDAREGEGLSLEQAEAIAEAAVEECERFYPVFQFVLWGGKSPGEAIAAALIDTHGEA